MNRLNINTVKVLSLLLLALLSLKTHAAIIVINGLSHEHSLQKGENAKGVIIVQNNGTKAEPVVVYQRDYSFNYEGQSFYHERGVIERSNMDWMVINPLNLVIEPNEEVEIAYEIRVPDEDSLRGSFWSMIMVEPGEDFDTSKTANSIKIRSVTRYAIQIISNIISENNNAISELKFLNIELTKSDSASYLNVFTENSGETFLRTRLEIEIFSPEGESLGVFKSKRLSTYPGTSRRYVIQIPQLETGNYQSLLIADSGQDEVLGASITLEITDE